MALEILRPGAPYIYHIDPDNPLIIERSRDKKPRRWEWFRLCKSAEEARQILLKLNTKERQP